MRGPSFLSVVSIRSLRRRLVKMKLILSRKGVSQIYIHSYFGHNSILHILLDGSDGREISTLVYNTWGIYFRKLKMSQKKNLKNTYVLSLVYGQDEKNIWPNSDG